MLFHGLDRQAEVKAFPDTQVVVAAEKCVQS